MEIDRKLVEHLSRLCRIELGEEEISTFLPQLRRILSYVEKINALDLEGVPPSASAIEVFNVYHKDEPRVFGDFRSIFPEGFLTPEGMVSVPAVIERGA